jgi:hypothetical protein
MRGNLISARAVADIPRVLLWSVAREVIGRRPILPWIPFDAVRCIEGLLHPTCRVLEYGAGMSTIWFAERSGCVHSIETSQTWHDTVATMLQERGIHNVRLDLREDAPESTDLSDCDGRFDFVLVDGAQRQASVCAALGSLKPQGSIYLDNTDFGVQWDFYASAERTLLEAAARDGATVRYFTGFAPATFVATQGVLVRWHLPARAG